jgi:competence protein ComGC
MKARFQKQRNRALTLPELLMVIAMLIVLAYIFLPVFARNIREGNRDRGINCVSNLKQVDLSFRIWEGDNDNKYPMVVSVTNGGAMETMSKGDVVDCFFVMSNELSTPKILICPADVNRVPATNFMTDFDSSHISYFVGVDVTNEDPAQRVLCGDDNFVINGSPIKSGLVEYPTNVSIAWGSDRHKLVGNIGLADGSVLELSISGLQTAFLQSGLATNRLAIP